MPATCAVSCQINDQKGQPLAGAVVVATLNGFEIDQGYIAPKSVEATTDALGKAVLNLWPNQAGALASFYKVKITSPNGQILRTKAVVPNAPTAQLHLISEIPPYEGKTASRIALDDLNNVSTLVYLEVTKAQTFAVNAAASAATAVAAANAVATGGLTDRHYAHEQSTAAATWDVPHNMNKYPSVTITDSAGDEVEGEVRYNGLNSLVVSFSAPFAGKAYLN
jgi:hypothetical protein